MRETIFSIIYDLDDFIYFQVQVGPNVGKKKS